MNGEVGVAVAEKRKLFRNGCREEMGLHHRLHYTCKREGVETGS